MKLWISFKKNKSSPESLHLQLNIEHLPVPVGRIANLLGVQVNFCIGEGWHGSLKSDVETSYAQISIDSNQTRAQQRLMCAVELGHLLLHASNVEYYDVVERCKTREDREAYDFAARLLIPGWMILEQVHGGMRISDLANTFNVPVMTMQKRLETFGGYVLEN